MAVTLVMACQPGGSPARVWTARDFYRLHETREPQFGGWSPYELARLPGETTWLTEKPVGPDAGLTVFPILIGGKAMGTLILDIWQDHPAPWLQPVYSPATDRNGTLAPIEEADTVFPVDVGSSFYSPWWQRHLVPVRQDELLLSAQAALSRTVVPTNEVVLCPIVPNGTGVASEEDGAAHDPVTRSRLLAPRPTQAFVDSATVSYLPFGPNRIRHQGQALDIGDIFIWVDGETSLPAAAIGPTDIMSAGLVRRTNVQVPAGAAFFVPANRPELRRAFANQSLVPVVDPALNAQSIYTLRLTLNRECLTPAGFGACRWVSTEAEVRQLSSGLLRPRPVLASLGILEPAP